MIVKDEENNLPGCIGSCADLVHEIIIVDTGSTDRTVEVAESLGAKVFRIKWPNSFAAARNVAKRQATGDWIFWMDADDRIDEENREKMRVFLRTLNDDMAGYLFKCLVLPSGPTEPLRMVDHCRLFRNHPQIRWHYRVHEQVLPAIHQLGGDIRHTDIVVRHIGYQDGSKRPDKLVRNCRLLEADQQDNPNDAFTLYNLGRIKERMGKMEEAIPHWRRSLELADPGETFVRKVYALLAQAHHKLGQKSKMLGACLAGITRFPDDPELLFLASGVLYEIGELAAVEACLLRLIALPDQVGFQLGDDLGVRTFKARTQLGRIYRDTKRYSEAEAQFRAAVKENPDFGQALLGLGQVLFDLKRPHDADQVLAQLENNPHTQAEAAVLAALKHVINKDYNTAKQVLNEAALNHPQAVEPRILLARLLFRERAQNPGAAEKALRDILVLDPGNSEAKSNLEKLHTPAAAKPKPQSSAAK